MQIAKTAQPSLAAGWNKIDEHYLLLKT